MRGSPILERALAPPPVPPNEKVGFVGMAAKEGFELGGGGVETEEGAGELDAGEFAFAASCFAFQAARRSFFALNLSSSDCSFEAGVGVDGRDERLVSGLGGRKDEEEEEGATDPVAGIRADEDEE